MPHRSSCGMRHNNIPVTMHLKTFTGKMNSNNLNLHDIDAYLNQIASSELMKPMTKEKPKPKRKTTKKKGL